MLQLHEPLRAITEDQSAWPIGVDLNGGYFAGMFTLNTEVYGLIVAPRDLGETEDISWGAYRRNINALSYVDGLANTRVMAEMGNKEAQLILRTEINGFNDWYIPSRDELELIYRNLKPTADANLSSHRDGENPSSIPPGYPYTSFAPTRTWANLFQSGGAQAMAPGYYWSSTESSMYAAWTQHFRDGQHHTDHKNARHKIRAVRRFKMLR